MSEMIDCLYQCRSCDTEFIVTLSIEGIARNVHAHHCPECVSDEIHFVHYVDNRQNIHVNAKT